MHESFQNNKAPLIGNDNSFTNGEHDENDVSIEDDGVELDAWQRALVENKKKKDLKKINEEKPEIDISDNDEF